MKIVLENLSLIISLILSAIALSAYYRSSITKDYAAKRDFEHLKRNYEQLASNQAAILKELDARFDQQMLEIKDVKGLLTALVVKVLPGESTGGWRRGDLGGS